MKEMLTYVEKWRYNNFIRGDILYSINMINDIFMLYNSI